MKQFSLEEYLANPSRRVVTRGGDTVKIHCTNYFGPNPIIAEIESSGQSCSYNADGSYFSDEESVRDLFFVTEEHEGWINLYSGRLHGSVFNSKEEAKSAVLVDDSYIATVKIEWGE